MINIDISVGDQILVGRFKNKKIEVKDIGVDKHGGPTINGRSILKIRKMKSPNERREAVNNILDTMKKKSLGEAKEIGGYYLMKQLKDLARDSKRSGEKKVAKALMYLHDRINQSSRDIDLSADDLNDFLNDPRGRKHAKDLPDWMIDDLFEGITVKAHIRERIERDEVHAETKKELKTAIARSMKEILAGKTPKYDIINGRTGEMIGWKDGKDYIWQPDAIPYAEQN